MLSGMKLSPKQKIFVAEYIKDKNGARAARAAGYSKHTARITGAQLLTKPNIRKAVDAGLEKQMVKAEITAEKILNRIAEFAFNKKRIEPKDILKANELLGKHFKLFTDVSEVKAEHKVSVVDPTKVKASIDDLESEV